MKRFIYKTSFFVGPFMILYFVSLTYYSHTETPDLLRMGSIPNMYKDFSQTLMPAKTGKVDLLSKTKKRKYEILTIGDSFSDQEGLGYNDLLSNDFSVLHVDRFISKNQLQTLINLTNGDFFETYDIEYVILQNVERHVIENSKNIRLNDKILLSQIDTLVKNHKVKKGTFKNNFFSKMTLKFPFYHLPKFIFQKNYLANGSVYNLHLNTNSLFRNHSDHLLFYYLDLESTHINNIKSNIDTLNMLLNGISENLLAKNIKLIVLPAPDKYDFYYSYISDKKNYPKPIFFDLMNSVEKKYIYIDSKKILTSKMQKDMYFYEESHWSPIAAKILADEIKVKINAND